ncbi:MAG: flagellar basal body rod protein FlgB [Calditerrivibrio sp.]|nr:flagellar basal body rod protein FlgB [Calditerrivibrio sp.]
MDIFNKSLVNDLSYALRVNSVKNSILANNIANVDTPKYKAKKLEFTEVMQEYFSGGSRLPLKTTNHKHIKGGINIDDPSSFVRLQNNPSLRNDGNDVNLDYEMSEMAKNSIQYSMFSQIISGKFTGLKSAIQGR